MPLFCNLLKGPSLLYGRPDSGSHGAKMRAYTFSTQDNSLGALVMRDEDGDFIHSLVLFGRGLDGEDLVLFSTIRADDGRFLMERRVGVSAPGWPAPADRQQLAGSVAASLSRHGSQLDISYSLYTTELRGNNEVPPPLPPKFTGAISLMLLG